MPQLPLQMVCSSKFGRYPKISSEQVFNMFQADGWMIAYAGYILENVLSGETGTGRGIFYSSRANKMYVVVNEKIYEISASGLVLTPIFIHSLDTAIGDVYIDENLKSQIAFCDGSDIYIYDYVNGVFQKLALGFSAGYVMFQDSRFIVPVNGKPEWRLSDDNLLAIDSATVNDGGSGYVMGDILSVDNGVAGTLKVSGVSGTAITDVTVETEGYGYSDATYPTTAVTGSGTDATFNIVIKGGFTASSGQIGSFQTKPDNARACVRMPGKTGQLLVMGSIVTEVWTDLGLQLFPYQRNSSYNIDYGCLNAATIATGDDFVVWLGSNEKSGPVIMHCSGGGVNQISTDGINFRLSELKNPENSYGFVFKQDGHVFYQLTFPGVDDNVTYIYDFTTQKFYTLCDIERNYHIARRVAYFNNTYFFISYNDTNLYRLDSNLTTFGGKEIPRIIITPTSGLPTRLPFIVNSLTFPIEQGENILNARVDLSCSSDGGITFGNEKGVYFNAYAKRRNIFKFYNLGRYNEVIFQFKFWGFNRFVLTNGVAEVTQ